MTTLQTQPDTPVRMGVPVEPAAAPGLSLDIARLDELSQIIQAYNSVTQKLQESHEALRIQVERLQEQLASKDAQLQRSRRLAALGEMAAGIAHEVRNPLAAIQLYAEMIAADETKPQPGSPPSSARKIISAVRGLDAIVRDVLTFAREMEVHRTSFAVHDLFDRALHSHRPALDAGDIVVDRNRAEESLEIHGDFDLLHRALLNLIRNAVEAMTDRSAPCPDRVLGLRVARIKRRMVLTVRDRGAGIPDDALDRIFNPFFTTRATGTGLGLAIVHRIVDAHGGSITVRNDGGALFEISLPIQTPAAAPRRGRSRLQMTGDQP